MNRFLILTSSAATMAGQYAGSTSRAGALFYTVGGVTWAWWMCRNRQWDFLPINLFGSAVTAWNLVVAFGIRF